MKRTFSVNQIKVGDKVVLRGIGGGFGAPAQDSLIVTGKKKGFDGLVFQLTRIAGFPYKYHYEDRRWWSAKELSQHYADVYRGDKLIGTVTTKYW